MILYRGWIDLDNVAYQHAVIAVVVVVALL